MSALRGLEGPVLAAIDLTETADEILAQANAIAGSLKTSLIVSHVIHETLRVRMLFPQLAGADAAGHAALEQQVLEAVEARVAAVTRRAAGDFSVAIDSGSPHAGILRRAEQARAGLLVVGPGSVAERVARYATCAVLVARRSPRGGVLAATDFSDPALPAIEIAAAEAARRGTWLRLLHCLEFSEPVLLGPPRMAVGVLPALPGELVQELERDAGERLRASLARFAVKGECLLTRGTAAGSIVEAARTAPTELVVIGTRGRSNLRRLLLGSVAETVLRTAPCSVMVVRLAQ